MISVQALFYLPVKAVGTLQILRVRVSLGNAAHQLERPKGVEAFTAEFPQYRTVLLLRDLQEGLRAGSFVSAIGADEKHRFSLGQILPGKRQDAIVKFSEINTRGKADAVILLQPGRLLRGHIDEVDPALSGHGVQNFPGKQVKERHILCDISDLPLNTPAEINIARQRIENILAQTDEIQYANDQCNQWQEIADYMTLLIKGGGKLVYDEDNAIEVPKDETPAYLEWTLWRAALAIDHMVNKPYEVRGFKLDSDFMPVSAAGGGKGDLYCEFDDFTILTEVTMSTSSRQEAMEGEPVRRHVSDAVLKYEKPVYGMFIAVKIDTNTAETFRHGIWYARGDMKQHLDIVPLTLEQFQEYFVAMFEGNQAKPEHLRDLILECETKRDILETPEWKQYINTVVTEKAYAVRTGIKHTAVPDGPIVLPGAMVRHVTFGVGQVVGLMASFPGCQAKTMELPYLKGLPDEVSMAPNGNTLHHNRFGEGKVFAYIIVFNSVIMPISYPSSFLNKELLVE